MVHMRTLLTLGDTGLYLAPDGRVVESAELADSYAPASSDAPTWRPPPPPEPGLEARAETWCDLDLAGALR
jgi:hypothetical protein